MAATSFSTPSTSVDPLELQGLMNDLLGFNSTAAELKSASDASLVSVEGANAEAAAYSTEAALAGGNQQTEAISEQVRELQIQRNVDQTVGAQKATVASNGFAQSGSALDIMRSSYRQGYLGQQISAMQSEEVQRGYLESAAAAEGDMTAAQVRASGAQALSDAQLAASTTATANAAAVTSAMTQLLAGDQNAQALVDALTSGDTSAALAAVDTYNTNGSTAGGTNDQPVLPPAYSGTVFNQNGGFVQSTSPTITVSGATG